MAESLDARYEPLGTFSVQSADRILNQHFIYTVVNTNNTKRGKIMYCDRVQCYWNNNGLCSAEKKDTKPSFCPVKEGEDDPLHV